MIWAFRGKTPEVGEGTFVFPTADVIGDVVLGKNCYVGPGARLRGDYGRIEIGDGTAIEENVVVHARPGDVTHIGGKVTVGHGAIVHNATIEDWAVIGMGAIVSDWAVIGEWAVVAEGAVVPNKKVVPARRVVAGVPCKEFTDTSEEYIEQWTGYKGVYEELASQWYQTELVLVEAGRREPDGWKENSG